MRRFESEFLAFMAQKYPDVAPTIAKENDLSEATAAKLGQAVGEFKAQFKA